VPVDGLIFFIALLAVAGYSGYVAVLVTRANFYSTGQKIAQVLLALLVPVLGTITVHWMYRLHLAPAKKPDRAFTPQDDDRTGTAAGGMPPHAPLD
jgi:NADH:ubiquinone oxidoreductase subunit 5 (subunit L)/multisubunit Na+/H+ antiporter MnhA subunit